MEFHSNGIWFDYTKSIKDQMEEKIENSSEETFQILTHIIIKFNIIGIIIDMDEHAVEMEEEISNYSRPTKMSKN